MKYWISPGKYSSKKPARCGVTNLLVTICTCTECRLNNTAIAMDIFKAVADRQVTETSQCACTDTYKCIEHAKIEEFEKINLIRVNFAERKRVR